MNQEEKRKSTIIERFFEGSGDGETDPLMVVGVVCGIIILIIILLAVLYFAGPSGLLLI